MKIYKINSEKFKSIYISYNFTMKVEDLRKFSYNAILAALMSKSSNKYKTQKEIEKYLSSLYGAIYDVNIEKFGDLYNLEFRVEYINKKFIDGEDLTNKILAFLHDVIYDVADWEESSIQREKEFIIEKINERKDEKLKYGVQRMEEILCEGEPFGTYLYGQEEIVKSVDKDILKLAYKELINSSVTVIISGNLSGYEDIDKKVDEIFSDDVESSKKLEELEYNLTKNKKIDYDTIVEKQDTTQSVISMGYYINNVDKKDFYSINLFNAILGTTPSSKLFQNVREKESLAYTVRSRYYRFKDIIIIYAGINKENFEKAKTLINEQVESIKRGDISKIEFETAKDSVLADLKEWNDSKVAMSKMQMANMVGFKKDDVTIDEMRDNISKVTLEDVVSVAKKVELKKVFVLGGVENV